MPLPPPSASNNGVHPAQQGVQYPATTDSNGIAKRTVTSQMAATISVAAKYRANEFESVTMPLVTVTFTAATGVSSTSLTPVSQTVRPGRYAQLTAALTPALSGVKVDCTVTRDNPMRAELEGSPGEGCVPVI